MHPDWARSLRDQCVAAGVAFHFKQWGEWLEFGGEHWQPPIEPPPEGSKVRRTGRATWLEFVGKRAAGRMLDGREWNEYPAQAGIKES